MPDAADPVAAYAARSGTDVETLVRQQGLALQPADVGRHMVDLATSRDHTPGAYLLTQDGLSVLH